MSKRAKRSWFRLHLTTALAMTFVLGGLMLATERTAWIEAPGPDSVCWAGWPDPAIAWGAVPDQHKGPFDDEKNYISYWHGLAINRLGLQKDIILWIAILIDVAFFSEWMIRRNKTEST
jgi:hypothetical protein